MISLRRRRPSFLIPSPSAKLVPNKLSSVASKRPYNEKKARNSDIYQITQPIEHANRYTMLASLPETTNSHDGNVVPKITKATQISTNNYEKKKDHIEESRIHQLFVTQGAPLSNFHQAIMRCKVSQLVIKIQTVFQRL